MIMTTAPVLRNDFDTPWKEILDHYFRAFLEYCYPDIAADIDWASGYQSIDKELSSMFKDTATGPRRVDKLFKVWRKSGEETWVLMHLEVQAQHDTDFSERMFTYYYRLMDRHKVPIASLAVLTDDSIHWRPSVYRNELWGCVTEMRYLTVKLLDYRDKIDELKKINNPFGIVILAHLKMLETAHDEQARLRNKITLTKSLYEHGWERKDIINLYRFLDWIMILPISLAIEYQEEIKCFEEKKDMQYITTAERIGLEKGIEQGMREGIQKGIQEGLIKGEVTFLLRLLQRKFSSVPKKYQDVIKKADAKTLLIWGERVLDAKTFSDIFDI